MENLVPIYGFLFELIVALKSGRSLHESIPHLLESKNDDFNREFRIWWLCYNNNNEIYGEFSTHHRKLLAQVLLHGLQGLGVLGSLEEVFKEIESEIENRQQLYLERLPFKLLLPLLLCFLPAFLILLFGPLLIHIQQEIFS